MCEIVNNVYSEEDLYDAFETIADRLYLYTDENERHKYYRVIISEITEEECLKEEDVQ